MNLTFRVTGQAVSFSQPEVLLGRSRVCDVQLAVPDISRAHCKLLVREDEVWVQDLGSLNGTFINGRRVTGEEQLQHGDQLSLGTTILDVEINSESPESVHVLDEGPGGQRGHDPTITTTISTRRPAMPDARLDDASGALCPE